MDFRGLLNQVGTRQLRSRLVRCIPQLDFNAGDPPSYLFVSGRRNRCNPGGVECLYFSEDEATADAEYREQWAGTAAAHQPKLTFYAEARLANVIDLGDSEILKILNLMEREFSRPWRRAKKLTPLQRLGGAIASQSRISAIRYPSSAAQKYGFPGFNVVVFRTSMREPDSLRILGKTKKPLETWP